MRRLCWVIACFVVLWVGSACSPSLEQNPEEPSVSPTAAPTVSWRGSGGYRIAVGSSINQNTDLYLINPDGTELVRLTDSPLDESDPVWSPDGNHLAYRATNTSDGSFRTQLCVMDLDQAHSNCLVEIPDETAVSWSPDGTRLAYIAPGNNEYEGFLSTIGIDATQQTTLIKFRFHPQADTVIWLPDGKHLLYGDHEEDGYGDLRLVDLDTRESRLLAPDLAETYAPTVAASGSPIVFLGLASKGDASALYALDLTQPTGPQQLTNSADESIMTPSISPDGQFVAFAGVTEDTWTLYRMPIGDSSAEREQLFSRPLAVNGDPVGFYQPVWSPDGRYLAFRSLEEGDWDQEIYVITTDGARLVQATRNKDFESLPSWSPLKVEE